MSKDGNQGQRVYPHPTPNTDSRELDSILNTIFSYLDVGEAGLLFDDEQHRAALEKALNRYTANKRR